MLAIVTTRNDIQIFVINRILETRSAIKSYRKSNSSDGNNRSLSIILAQGNGKYINTSSLTVDIQHQLPAIQKNASVTAGYCQKEDKSSWSFLGLLSSMDRS